MQAQKVEIRYTILFWFMATAAVITYSQREGSQLVDKIMKKSPYLLLMLAETARIDIRFLLIP